MFAGDGVPYGSKLPRREPGQGYGVLILFCYSASFSSSAFFSSTPDWAQPYSQFHGSVRHTPSAKGMKMDSRPTAARIQQYHMPPTMAAGLVRRASLVTVALVSAAALSSCAP